MKNVSIVCFSLLLSLFIFVSPLTGVLVSAADGEEDYSPEEYSEDYHEDYQEPAPDANNDIDASYPEETLAPDISFPDSVNVDVNGFSTFVDTFESTLSNSPVSYTVSVIDDAEPSPPPEHSVLAAMQNLFGEYHRLTYTQLIVLDDGEVVESEEYVPGLAGMDWEYIVSVAVFCLMLYCLFRLLGGIVTHD